MTKLISANYVLNWMKIKRLKANEDEDCDIYKQMYLNKRSLLRGGV